MAAGLGAESLAAKFRLGESPDRHYGTWLLLEAADTATEGRLAKNYGVFLLRATAGEALHMKKSKAAGSQEKRRASTPTSSSFRTGSWWAG